VLYDPEKGIPSLTSYSVVGHLVHVNLRDNMLDQKEAIGQILLLRKNARTVVRKTNEINNEFRFFSMELLAGEPDYVVKALENGCTFRMDFSKVYWNPRLCTEHMRLVDLLRPGDVLADAFAGVGPFAVPAAKKKSIKVVEANDLNPESYRWLVENRKGNQISEDRLICHCGDARLFIKAMLVKYLLQDVEGEGKLHVAMNLPATATGFVDAFRGALPEDASPARPVVAHVYAFAPENEAPEKVVLKECAEALDVVAIDDAKVSYVRNVSPNKGMYRATFTVPPEVLLTGRGQMSSQSGPTEAKRTKVT